MLYCCKCNNLIKVPISPDLHSTISQIEGFTGSFGIIVAKVKEICRKKLRIIQKQIKKWKFPRFCLSQNKKGLAYDCQVPCLRDNIKHIWGPPHGIIRFWMKTVF